MLGENTRRESTGKGFNHVSFGFQARAVPSVLWLLPRAGTNASVTWTTDDVLVSTPSRNYTAFDLDSLLQDAIPSGADELVVRSL